MIGRRCRSGAVGIALLMCSCGSALPASARASAPFPPRFTAHLQSCPGQEAIECADVQTDDVYLMPGVADRFAFWHGLGHIFDAEVLTGGDRWWFMRMVGMEPPQPWLPPPKPKMIAEPSSPGEKFADAYAACALNMNPEQGAWEGSYDYQPSTRRHRQICAGIWRMYGRYVRAHAGTISP